MWDLPRPGFEPVSPALAGGFLSTAPPGKSQSKSFFLRLFKSLWRDFPGGAVLKNPPASAGDTGLNPGPEDPTCRGATKPLSHSY